MITLRMEGFEKARAHISGLSKQVAFAASKALNETAKAIAAAMPEEIEKTFDKPTPFTKRGVGVLKYANKANLEVTVGFRPAQARYMKLQIEGGSFNPGSKGLKLPSAIKLNDFGNIPKGVIAQMMAVARKESGMKKATSKRIRVSNKVDLFYGTPEAINGKQMPRGIYKAVNGALIPLVVFPTATAKYSSRFDFQGKAKAIAERVWKSEFDKALAEAIRTAKVNTQ